MKIGFETAPRSFPETYSQHLAKVLSHHAPQHEYLVEGARSGRVDIYHGSRAPLPLGMRLRGVRCVMTVADLNFLHYPHIFSLFDRMVRLRLYKLTCRTADCVIVFNRHTAEELSEHLGIDRRRIRVLPPLGVHPPRAEFDRVATEQVRRKYSLPERYVLMTGAIEPRHYQVEVLRALLNQSADVGLVVCGRQTRYSDLLLQYARGTRFTAGVELLYEPDPNDFPALFRMAQAFVCIPDPQSGTSLLSVVEALRAGVPMVLSDTPQHREVAGEAALYVPSGDPARMEAAVECVLCDEQLRRLLARSARHRAKLFSEQVVASRMIEIYSSL